MSKKVWRAGEYVKPTQACSKTFHDEIKWGARYKIIWAKESEGTNGRHVFIKLRGLSGEWDTSWFRRAKVEGSCQHSPKSFGPKGYISWHVWAQERTLKGWRASRCPVCKLFVVWKLTANKFNRRV